MTEIVTELILTTCASTATRNATLNRDALTGYLTGTVIGSTTSDQTFTDFGEVKHLGAAFNGAALYAQDVTERDALGRITHLTETVSGAAHQVAYEYDLAGRLKSEIRDGVVTRYAYDPNGNRTSVQVGSNAAVTASYDAQDRIQTYGTRTYTHTDHGDLLTIVDGAKTSTFTYDELGNLLKVIVTEGTMKTTVEYVVDGLGRRVARRVNGAFDRAWLYRDSLRPVSEVDASGTFTHFVYSSNHAESGAPLALIRGGILYRVVKDHLGSVRLVVNAQTGAVAQTIDYDAYGRVLKETGAGFQPFGFAGGLYDSTTNLVRFGARDYDATTGRWTNKDPIGFAGQQGNQYLYVNGDPVNLRDPQGTVLPVAAMIIGGVIGAGFNAYDAYKANKGGWAIAGAALLGAGTGAVSALGGGLFATLALGAGMGVLNKGGMNEIVGERHTVAGYVGAAAAGIGGGIIGYRLASRATGKVLQEGLAGSLEFFSASAERTLAESLADAASRRDAVLMYNELVRMDQAKWSCIGNIVGGLAGGVAGEFAP